MASPLSIASSLDSIWSTGSLSISSAARKLTKPVAELLPGPPTNAKSMAVANTTGLETPLVSRVFPTASASAIPLRNASSPMASDRRDESPTSQGASTPSSSACSTEYLDEISDDSLVVACRKLRRHLRAHYPNTKPPGDLFEPFIQRLRRQNHCQLCSKVLDNREQMNQHIMKNHCGHLPFACPVQGWCVMIDSLNIIGYVILTLESLAITETLVKPIYENILRNTRMCGCPALRGKYNSQWMT